MNDYEAKRAERVARMIARAELKRWGWRWAPSAGAWQRHLATDPQCTRGLLGLVAFLVRDVPTIQAELAKVTP